MKKLFLFAILLLAAMSACSQRRDSSSKESVSFREAISQASEPEEAASSAPGPVTVQNSSSETSAPARQTAETAVFSLGLQGGDEKIMEVGDTIGDWTLSDLQITYGEEKRIEMLVSEFSGEVTLKGEISRSGIVDAGYDFWVDKEDNEKMPRYISPEMGDKGGFQFMLDIPEDLANAPKLEHGEQMKCKITVSRYRFIFAYRMAPSGATVTTIEPA